MYSNDYTYRTGVSWVSMPPSLSTPSTCFSSRYFASSTATYRTPFSRYDRSNSTPVRYHEPVTNFYTRCLSEEVNRNPSPSTKMSSNRSRHECIKTGPGQEDSNTSGDKLTKPDFKVEGVSSYWRSRTGRTLNERRPYSSNPLYSEHVARYHQRINDIFEKKEEEEEKESDCPLRIHPEKSRSSDEPSSIRTKPTFKSVLEDVKELEKKYKQANLEEERQRKPTEYDHYRPGHSERIPHYYPKSFQKLSDQEPTLSNVPSRQKYKKADEADSVLMDPKREDLYSKTLRLYRDAATPPTSFSSSPFASSLNKSQQYHISPDRYLAANLKTDIYNRSNINTNYSLRDYKRVKVSPSIYRKAEVEKPLVPEKPAPTLNDAESRSRHPNRETRLANMLLQHIQTEKRWTSGVDHPFVLGI